MKGDELRFNVEGQYGELARSLKELGILYGRISRNEFVVVGLSTGIGYVNGTGRGGEIGNGKFEQIDISTFSIPLEATVRVDIAKYAGIGGSLFGNVNTQKTYLGGALNLYIGKS